MTHEQQTVLLIKGAIASLPPTEQDACRELCEHLRHVIKQAGETVGTLPLALVGAEEQAKS